ncbi:MAG: tetratricopeptide repeat protein, partial [Bryobacteraceae bacterium]
GPPSGDFDAWCKSQPWFDKEDEYSVLFEALFPDERARQRYMEEKIENIFPGWGYLYLANLIQNDQFNVCFTTNFDDLVHQALSTYAGYNPIVCTVDSQVKSVNITSRRAKIIKLHGDYLFKKLKNTREELKQLDPNMQEKFQEFAKFYGMLVLGYAGQDLSVMGILERILTQDERYFENGIFWGIRSGSPPAPRVADLAARFPGRVRLFQFDDFDVFMAKLHAYRKLKLPKPILQPFDALRDRYTLLIRTETADTRSDREIDSDRRQLQDQLKLPWAKANNEAQLDLLQAQLSLGRREYEAAIQHISKFIETQPEDIDGLTTFGYALAQQGDDQRSDAILQSAAEKWQAAVALEAKQPPRKALQARYGLVRYFSQKQMLPQAIAECEALLAMAPADRAVHEQLVQLYAASLRYDDAQRELQWLLDQFPSNAQYHALRASVLDQKGMAGDALEEMQRAVNLDGGNAWLRASLAELFMKLSRLDEAARELEEAIRLGPGNLDFRLQIATLYTNRQMLTAALPHLEAAVRLGPNSSEARGWLGQTYLFLGRLTDAQRELEAMLSLSRNDVRAEVMAGVLFLRMNRRDLAETHLREATRVDPREPRAWYWMGIYMSLQNRFQEIGPVMQTLAQIDPPTAQLLQFQLNNWQTAVAALFPPPGAAQPPFAPPLPQPQFDAHAPVWPAGGAPQGGPQWLKDAARAFFAKQGGRFDS